MAFKLLRAARVPERSVHDMRRMWHSAKKLQALGTDPCDLWRLHPRGDYFLKRGGETVPPPNTVNLALNNKCTLRSDICGRQKHLYQAVPRHRNIVFQTVDALWATHFSLPFTLVRPH